jgi:hypothetical protein
LIYVDSGAHDQGRKEGRNFCGIMFARREYRCHFKSPTIVVHYHCQSCFSCMAVMISLRLDSFSSTKLDSSANETVDDPILPCRVFSPHPQSHPYQQDATLRRKRQLITFHCILQDDMWLLKTKTCDLGLQSQMQRSIPLR